MATFNWELSDLQRNTMKGKVEEKVEEEKKSKLLGCNELNCTGSRHFLVFTRLIKNKP